MLLANDHVCLGPGCRVRPAAEDSVSRTGQRQPADGQLPSPGLLPCLGDPAVRFGFSSEFPTTGHPPTSLRPKLRPGAAQPPQGRPVRATGAS